MPDSGDAFASAALSEWMGDDAADSFVRSDGVHHVVDLPGGNRSGTLFVHFDALPRIAAQARWGTAAADVARKAGWSRLAVLSEGSSWFRSSFLTSEFDARADDEWFDRFDQILFYGAGAGGYAAAAYAAAAPGARVLALAPVASLSAEVALWDTRDPAARRLDWEGYGYAPDMIEAASEAFVVFDPRVPRDGAHAALFRRPGVTRLTARGAGQDPELTLRQCDALSPLIRSAAAGYLDEETFAEIWRLRRASPRYLLSLADRLNEADRRQMLRVVLREGLGKVAARRFQTMAKREGLAGE